MDDQPELFVQSSNDQIVILDNITDLRSSEISDRLKFLIKPYLGSVMNQYRRLSQNSGMEYYCKMTVFKLGDNYRINTQINFYHISESSIWTNVYMNGIISNTCLGISLDEICDGKNGSYRFVIAEPKLEKAVCDFFNNLTYAILAISFETLPMCPIYSTKNGFFQLTFKTVTELQFIDLNTTIQYSKYITDNHKFTHRENEMMKNVNHENEMVFEIIILDRSFTILRKIYKI